MLFFSKIINVSGYPINEESQNGSGKKIPKKPDNRKPQNINAPRSTQENTS